MPDEPGAVLPGSTGAIASALITGDRGGISEADEEALRDAGLAHVLAIAGLHMALVGLGLFWTVRAVLALWPRVVLTQPIKKWAACAALGGAAFYLIISGAGTPADRRISPPRTSQNRTSVAAPMASGQPTNAMLGSGKLKRRRG